MPNSNTDRVVPSFDGFETYLLIVDAFARHTWVFLTCSKEPPVDIASDFLAKFSQPDRCVI